MALSSLLFGVHFNLSSGNLVFNTKNYIEIKGTENHF